MLPGPGGETGAERPHRDGGQWWRADHRDSTIGAQHPAQLGDGGGMKGAGCRSRRPIVCSANGSTSPSQRTSVEEAVGTDVDHTGVVTPRDAQAQIEHRAGLGQQLGGRTFLVGPGDLRPDGRRASRPSRPARST